MLYQCREAVASTSSGKTPADVAQENGHKEITDLLPFRDPGDPARRLVPKATSASSRERGAVRHVQLGVQRCHPHHQLGKAVLAAGHTYVQARLAQRYQKPASDTSAATTQVLGLL